jgi:hypothetical protein
LAALEVLRVVTGVLTYCGGFRLSYI